MMPLTSRRIWQALVDEPGLLCSISYLFVEYHSLHANLTRHGFPRLPGEPPGYTAYNRIGDAIRRAMDERPGCELRIHWRSFWNTCGDTMRFVWMGGPQATGREPAAGGSGRRTAGAAKRAGRRRQSKRGL